MAFSTSCQWEVESGGSDSNGGGFDPGGATFPTSGSATVANTASPVFSASTYNFVAGDVGAWLYIASGTNWLPGYYKIASVASNAATLDAAIGHAILIGGGPNTVVGCASVASPTVGTWGCDYSQQTTSVFTSATFAIDATTNTKLTDGTNTIGKNWVGNIINITGGTGFTVQRVQIISTAAAVATCDKSLGTLSSTGGTGNLGGALASPGQAGANSAASHTIWIKYATYTATSVSNNVAAGKVTLTAGTAALPTVIRGYDTVRGDETANRPTFIWGINASSAYLITLGNVNRVENLILDGARATYTQTQGISMLGGGKVWRCRMKSFALVAVNIGGSTNQVTFSEFTDDAGISLAIGSNLCFVGFCDFHDNINHGITVGAGGVVCIGSVFKTNKSGATVSGIQITSSSNNLISNCTFYNSGAAGIDITGATSTDIVNCHLDSNGGWGINVASVMPGVRIGSCSGYNNASGNFQVGNVSPMNVVNFLSVTDGPPLTAPAAGDLSTNRTPLRGWLLRSVAFPAALPNGTPSYRDIGASQSQSVLTPRGQVSSGGAG